MSKGISVGSRVVLVEDNRQGGPDFGRKGWRGVTIAIDSGDYHVKFDNRQEWWVNASAVALESPATDALTAWERDTALGMALELAKFVDVELSKRPLIGSGDAYDYIEVADWLRDCVARELCGGE